MCCQVKVSATGRSLVQRGPTECGVTECDHEASTIRRPRPTRAVETRKKRLYYIIHVVNVHSMSGTRFKIVTCNVK